MLTLVSGQLVLTLRYELRDTGSQSRLFSRGPRNKGRAPADPQQASSAPITGLLMRVAGFCLDAQS